MNQPTKNIIVSEDYCEQLIDQLRKILTNHSGSLIQAELGSDLCRLLSQIKNLYSLGNTIDQIYELIYQRINLLNRS